MVLSHAVRQNCDTANAMPSAHVARVERRTSVRSAPVPQRQVWRCDRWHQTVSRECTLIALPRRRNHETGTLGCINRRSFDSDDSRAGRECRPRNQGKVRPLALPQRRTPDSSEPNGATTAPSGPPFRSRHSVLPKSWSFPMQSRWQCHLDLSSRPRDLKRSTRPGW